MSTTYFRIREEATKKICCNFVREAEIPQDSSETFHCFHKCT